MQLPSPFLLRSKIYRVVKKGDILRSYYFENIIDSNACSEEGRRSNNNGQEKTRRQATEQGWEEGEKKTVEVLSIPDKGSKGN